MVQDGRKYVIHASNVLDQLVWPRKKAKQMDVSSAVFASLDDLTAAIGKGKDKNSQVKPCSLAQLSLPSHQPAAAVAPLMLDNKDSIDKNVCL